MSFINDYKQFSKSLHQVCIANGAPAKQIDYVCEIHLTKTMNELGVYMCDVKGVNWYNDVGDFHAQMYKNELLMYLVMLMHHTNQTTTSWAHEVSAWVMTNHPSLIPGFR